MATSTKSGKFSNRPRRRWRPMMLENLRSKLTWLGSVEARNEQEAIDRAIEKLGAREADRFRISVRRE
jgi:hypothetical protein